MTSVFNFRIQLLLSSCENRLSVNGLERLHPIPPKRHRHLGLTESVNEKLYELNFRTMCTISGSPSNGNRNFCRAHARALAAGEDNRGKHRCG
jgi:hypothetical protein